APPQTDLGPPGSPTPSASAERAPAGPAQVSADGTPGTDGPVALARALLATPARVLAGRQAFQAVDLAEVGFVLNASASEDLSQATKAVLAARSIDLATTPLDRVTQR